MAIFCWAFQSRCFLILFCQIKYSMVSAPQKFGIQHQKKESEKYREWQAKQRKFIFHIVQKPSTRRENSSFLVKLDGKFYFLVKWDRKFFFSLCGHKNFKKFSVYLSLFFPIVLIWKNKIRNKNLIFLNNHSCCSITK
jgi:hypothetical protein